MLRVSWVGSCVWVGALSVARQRKPHRYLLQLPIENV